MSNPHVKSGTVEEFRNERRFGFLKPDDSRLGQVFFHMNEGRLVKPGGRTFLYVESTGEFPLRVPQVSDRIIFRSMITDRGYRAQFWCYEEDYWRVAMMLAIPPIYRVVRRTVRDGEEPVIQIVWTGGDLAALQKRFPRPPRGADPDSDPLIGCHYDSRTKTLIQHSWSCWHVPEQSISCKDPRPEN